MDDVPVIVFCPVCCSPVDGQSSDTDFTCGTCGQKFFMKVDVALINAHSPV